MPRNDRVDYPSGARAAALFWILFGGLGVTFCFCGGFLILIGAGQAARNDPNAPSVAAVMTCLLTCFVLFYAVFLFVGIQTMRGAAKGLIGNGVGSIIFAILPITSGILGLTGMMPNRGGRNANPETDLIASVVLLIMGGGLLLAGILAITSNTAYQEWREAEGLDRPRRRRRDDDADYDDRPRRRDDDYDDRPRRRRDDDYDDDDDDDDRRPRRRDD